ncbi:MAG: UpxY family transcription antiterminator [Bacteroidia bacterium]|nr:UpxY family transcription antiterminator [Bacteroidia bacterium]
MTNTNLTNTMNFKKPKWYAIYARPRWEKKIHKKLEEKKITSFLPLIKTLHQWSDRKKMVEEPLFKSYLFVYIFLEQQLEVLSIKGVVSFVKFCGKLAEIPEQQIEAVRTYMDTDIGKPENFDKLEIGETIEVIKGPLLGLTGRLVKYYGKYKVLIKIEAINENIIINIPISHLRSL